MRLFLASYSGSKKREPHYGPTRSRTGEKSWNKAGRLSRGLRLAPAAERLYRETVVEAVMVLPGAEHAIVEAAKIRDYLLSHEHPIGRFKAVFFETLGYEQAEWGRLQIDLLHLGHNGAAVEGQKSQFGQKYEVRGTLDGPSGRRAEVVTVWVVLIGEVVPRFVTAYPG